jgi:hypothetical protein
MDKVFASAATALDGLLVDGMTIAAGGFGLCGIPENLIGALLAAGTEGVDHRRQQRRRGRLWYGSAAEDASGQARVRLVRRREQGVRTAGTGRRTGAASHPAGHAGRKAARRRRRHPRLLYTHRVSAPNWPRARRPRSSATRNMCWKRPSTLICRSSRHGKATHTATWCSAKPRATSIR